MLGLPEDIVFIPYGIVGSQRWEQIPPVEARRGGL